MRTRRRRTPRRFAQPDINLNSFLDLILNVLLFFVFSTELVMFNALDVAVPSSKDAESVSRNRAGVTILIDKNNRIYAEGAPISPDDLVTWITRKKSEPTFDGVIVRGDLNSNLQAMVDVLSICKRARVDRVRLETEQPKR